MSEIVADRRTAVAWLTLWFCLNVGLTLFNKAVFSNFNFPYPMALSCVHYFVSGLGAHMCCVVTKVERQPFDWASFKAMLMFSGIFNVNILLGNASIKVVSVALSQTVRAVIPACTMVVSFIILGTVYKQRIRNAVLPVIAGMVLACYGDMGNFTMVGMSILIAGCFASGFKVVMTKVLLSGKGSYHPFDLLSKVTPLCLMQLLPVVFLVEYPSMQSENLTMQTWSCVFATGLMAFMLNVANFFTNRLVSPLTITIAGNVKQVSTIIISILVFHTSVTPLNGLGIFVTLAGGAYYSYVSNDERESQLKAKDSNISLNNLQSDSMEKGNNPKE